MIAGTKYRGDFENCFLQAEDGIRDNVASRGLGDVYKKQVSDRSKHIIPTQ